MSPEHHHQNRQDISGIWNMWIVRRCGKKELYENYKVLVVCLVDDSASYLE